MNEDEDRLEDKNSKAGEACDKSLSPMNLDTWTLQMHSKRRAKFSSTK